MTDTAAVAAALDAVRDPELGGPVTSLGSVESCTVSADRTPDPLHLVPVHLLDAADRALVDLDATTVRGRAIPLP